jgi:hypothetical protein
MHRLRVFGNRVLRSIHGTKRDKGAGKWRKLHNKKLCNLYSLPNIITVIESGRMRSVVHVTHMEKMRNAYKILFRNLTGKDHFENLSIDGSIISEWILEK